MNFDTIQLDPSLHQPLYLQLFHAIKEMILSKPYNNKQKLMPIRQLAISLNINPSTVIQAYKKLEQHGYVSSKKGSGYYITYQPPITIAPITKDIKDNDINFANAAPNPSIFPTDSLKECIDTVLERDKGYAFDSEGSGYAPLRESICSLLNQNQIQTDSNHILVVSGSQQGLDLIGKALLHSGDYVISETPTYNGACAVFESRGASTIGVTLEDDGLNLIELEKKLRLYKPKLLYIMTNFQNPTSISYSQEKMEKILNLAEEYDCFIVEDDSMSELMYNENSPTSMKAMDTNERVVYLKSFSKLLMPGIRLGYMVLPKRLIPILSQVKYTTDISSSGLMQRALDLYIRKGKWQEHIAYMKEIYLGKYEVMLSGLEKISKISFISPQGGLYFWITLPPKIPANSFVQECRKQGVLILSSESFFHFSQLQNAVRISFAYPDIPSIKKGLAIMQTIIENW